MAPELPALEGDDDGLLADVAQIAGGATGQDAIARLEVTYYILVDYALVLTKQQVSF